MPEDTTKAIRIRLGTAALDLIKGQSELPANALDMAISELLHDRSRANRLEHTVSAFEARDLRQTEALSALALTCQAQTTAIGDLTDLVDHRTKEMVRIFTHISTLVGTKFTDGEELQRLHKRFQEMSEDLASQMSKLSDLVASKSREAAKTTGRLITSIEEQHLAVPLQGEQRTFEPEKGRGHER